MQNLKKIGLFIFSLILILAYLEIYLRLSGLSNPSYVYDDELVGRTHNKEYDIIVTGAEGFCIDKVNKFGYVGPAYTPRRNNNTIRIALLGSSYIEGLQVFRRNRFSTILENTLSKKLNKKVEILNFAIGGDDFRGMYIRYKKIVSEYKPDYSLFIIQSESLLKRKTIPSPDLVFQNDSLSFNYDFLNSDESKVRHRFRILREFGIGNMIKEAFEVYYTGRLPEIVFDKYYSPATNKIIVNKSDSVDKYYSLNKKIIQLLNNDNNNLNTKNIIVEMDNLPEIYLKTLDSLKFPRIYLYKDLNKYNSNDLLYWRASGIFGHWNNYAHTIVGHSLANDLVPIITMDIQISLGNKINH